jgi:hypothetical protein
MIWAWNIEGGRGKNYKIMLIEFISTDIVQLWLEWMWKVLLMVAYFMKSCWYAGFIEPHQLLDVLFNKFQITSYKPDVLCRALGLSLTK